MAILLLFGADGTPASIVIDGVTYRVPLVDSSGHLQVDALSSALPTDAATAARQDTMITALQLIDDLRTALATVATDQLRTDVISSALPSGAATETSLASILAKLDVALSTRALESGGNLASILAKLDVALSTRALESGGVLADILAKLDVALSTRALEAGGNLASILAKLDVALSTRALESGGVLADILAKLDVALSTRALESGGNLASILAKLDVALSTRALESGGNLASILAQMPALLWGYTDRYIENKSDLNPSGAYTTLTGSTVPSGEVWVVTNLNALDVNNPYSSLDFDIYDGTTAYIIDRTVGAAANVATSRQGNWVLKAGDRMRATFGGYTAGDDLSFSIMGYKMAIA